MTRALAIVLLFPLPLTAAAQRVEIAVFAGGFQPVPGVRTSGEILNCDEEPCPSTFRRTARGAGTAIGGRLTFQMSSRYGVDIVVQTTRMTNSVMAYSGPDGLEHVRLILFSLQPRFQFPLSQSVQAVVGAGLAVAFANATTVSPSPSGLLGSGMRNGLSFSSALQARLATAVNLEVRGSAYNYVPESGDSNRFELTWGIGLGYAFHKRTNP